MYCPLVQEDETYDSGKGVGWSCLQEWRIEALRLHRARCRGSAQLVSRRCRPGEHHKAGYLSTRVMLDIYGMQVAMRYEGGQSARSEQHRCG